MNNSPSEFHYLAAERLANFPATERDISLFGYWAASVGRDLKPGDTHPLNSSSFTPAGMWDMIQRQKHVNIKLLAHASVLAPGEPTPDFPNQWSWEDKQGATGEQGPFASYEEAWSDWFSCRLGLKEVDCLLD